MIKCNSCGSNVSENTKFCVNCGAKIEANNAQPTVPPPQPQVPQPQVPQPQVPQPQVPQPQVPPYNSGGVATKKKSNVPIIIIGIFVTVLVILVLAIVLIVNLFSGGVSDDPNIGIWKADEITMMGMTMSPTDIYPDGIILELKKGNNCTLSVDGDNLNGEYVIDGSTFTLVDGSDEFPGIIENNVITITNILNMGVDMTFVKDDWNVNETENSSVSGDVSLGETDNNGFSTDFVAPGYGTEQTVPVETLSKPSDWYGTVTISNYEGNNDISGEYEAWGYIGEDEYGVYFELYADGPVESEDHIDIMSFNIEFHDYSFFPVVDEYAWLYGGASLKEEDNTWYVPSLTNGVLGASYDYDYNGESFTLDFAIAMIPNVGSSDLSESAESSSDTATDTVSTPEPSVPTAIFTMEELKQIYYVILDLDIDELTYLTYEEIRDRYLDGVDGFIHNQTDTYTGYRWISTEAETSLLNISFKVDNNGDMNYSSMSINNISLDD